jgi:hypothetical protein
MAGIEYRIIEMAASMRHQRHGVNEKANGSEGGEISMAAAAWRQHENGAVAGAASAAAAWRQRAKAKTLTKTSAGAHQGKQSGSMAKISLKENERK